MATKIFRKGNIIVINDMATGENREIPVDKCRITRPNSAIDNYQIHDTQLNPRSIAFDLKLSDIVDENEDAYTETSFDTFRYEQMAYAPTAPALATEGYIYKEILISSADLISLDSTPIEFVDTLTGNDYYSFYGVLEYSAGTVAFTGQNAGEKLVINSNYIEASDLLAQHASQKSAFEFSSKSQGSSVDLDTTLSYQAAPFITQSINLQLQVGDTFATGNGTALVKLYYKVNTFGSAL